ncbi:MAG: S8 family serine peptidase, partial [Gammaproteobacteria bacterium]|nr:S8 family serine peptidase [Gammaproteobacteria bacterium]
MKTKLFAATAAAALAFMAGSTANASWSFGRIAAKWDKPKTQPVVASGMQALPVRVLSNVKQAGFQWEKGLTGEHRYIIRLTDEPLASYRGGIAGLAATNPDTVRAASRSAAGTTAVSGGVKLDTRSAASVAYLAYLDREHARFESKLRKELGRAEVMHRYRHAFNGMTVRMTQQQAARIARMAGVASVQRDFIRQIDTTNSVELIGSDLVWDGSATGGLEARGEGVLIGIIDTGINTDHPSFAEISPGDGYVHQNPLGDGVYLRDCAPFDQFTNPNGGRSQLCNSKLIGTMALPASAASVGQDTAEDWSGHGSHTAGTSGGNLVLDVPLVDFGGNPTGITMDKITGVAPRANISAYMACGDGGCPGSDLIAAIDSATADGVDVINYSIGGGPTNPWGDADSLAFLGSRDAGIFVATSASNSGPGASTVGSPADAPWLTSVAASTHQRAFSEKMVTDLSGGDTAAPGDLPGRSATGGYGPAAIVYAGDYGDSLCPLGEFPAGTFNGEIVLCDRGGFALVDKAQSAADGGAGGVIIATTATSAQGLFDISYVIPGIQMNQEFGDPLRDWLASGTGHTGTVTATTITTDMALADEVIGFSGRGPNASVPDIISPNISAPGVDVYAPYATPIEYIAISGTSMSSPHAAGAGALLRQVHPDWSAAEIHSALASTGVREMTREEDDLPATPFDYGGGRIRVDVAANAGLVMHETTQNFQAANPALDGDPTTLNLPSFGDASCLEVCTWERTVRATASATWTAVGESVNNGLGIEISPASFTLNEGDTATITVTADAQRLPLQEWAFGWVHLTPDNPVVSPQAMPLAVNPIAGILPEELKLKIRRNAGTQLAGGFTTGEISDLSIAPFALSKAALSEVVIEGDNGGEFSPFTSTGVDISFYDVSANSILFSASTSNSTAPDVDLFVGRDNNGDGQISEDEILCESGNPADIESCVLSGDVVTQGGSFWVAVVSFEASELPTDTTELKVYSVGPDDGSMSVAPPPVIEPGQPWEVRVGWDLDDLQEGDVYVGAIDVSANGSSLALIPVELTRLANDVRASASATEIEVGEMVDMQIEVEANLTPEDMMYVVGAEIPDGFELVPGSIS